MLIMIDTYFQVIGNFHALGRLAASANYYIILRRRLQVPVTDKGKWSAGVTGACYESNKAGKVGHGTDSSTVVPCAIPACSFFCDSLNTPYLSASGFPNCAFGSPIWKFTSVTVCII